MLTPLEQGEHMACLGGITRLAEGPPIQHDGGICPEHGVLRVLLRHLARLDERIADHGIAWMFAVLNLVDGRRDRHELCPDLPQKRAPSRRCRCQYEHSSSSRRP